MRFFIPARGGPVAQLSLVVKTLLPPLTRFGSFVTNQLDILVWVCILFHCSVHLSLCQHRMVLAPGCI